MVKQHLDQPLHDPCPIIVFTFCMQNRYLQIDNLAIHYPPQRMVMILQKEQHLHE